MIKLSPRITGFATVTPPFVAVIGENKNTSTVNFIREFLPTSNPKEFTSAETVVQFDTEDLEEGEILLVFPENALAHRFYRPNEKANTILLTERCDQNCVMCSQPPKSKDYLHWDLYAEAIDIVPQNAVIGISGGEPTLYKESLFNFIRVVSARRPDVEFHVLTNGQHFQSEDISTLREIAEKVVWGIPIYAAKTQIHDKIVGKNGAFAQLLEGFSYLLEAGARLELRTVVLKDNIGEIPKLAKFIARYFQWAEVWSIMQLEKIGFARIDWALKFEDTSMLFDCIEDAILISQSCGINVQLFNFPLCTVPRGYRRYCVDSISNWKKKFLEVCNGCPVQETCCGFFEWYTQNDGYLSLGRERL